MSLRKVFRALLRCGQWAVIISFVAVLLMRWAPVPFSAFMLERKLVAMWQGNDSYILHYHWVSREHISPQLFLAVVAAEDQKFPDHFGFDFDAMGRAWDHNDRHRRVRGASTISQQVAKNLFLWSSRSYLRKAVEAYFTVLIELLWSKDRILEVYVNIAELGNGVFGAGAAAEMFFGKSADRLTAREASLLAAVLPNPTRFSVRKPSGYVAARAAWITQQMRHLGGSAYLNQ